MTLYMVSWTWHEDYRPTLLEGPEQSDWGAYCDDLLPEAAIRAISKGEWVGWDTIVEQLVEMLLESGYCLVHPPERIYWGSSIIRDDDEDEPLDKLSPDIVGRIKDHNERFKIALRKRMAD